MDKANKTTAIIILLIVGVLAITLWYVRDINNKSEYEYNFFPFEKQGILWFTSAQKNGQPYTIPFYYHPTELEDVVAQIGIEQILLRAAEDPTNKTVYITLNPDMNSTSVIAAVEISRLTGSRYNILNLNTKSALTKPPSDSLANAENILVTCNDVSENVIVIYMTTSNANFIHEEQGCIVLEATDENNLVRVADRFAYMILGIMN